MSGIIVANPYPCDNPVASCGRAPELKRINQQLGCIALNDSTCTPLNCPEFPCGKVCPKPCTEDQDDSSCQATFSKLTLEDFVHDCEAFYAGMMKRALAQTPMKGCTGACKGPSAGTSQCCTITAGGPYTYQSAAAGYDAQQDLNPWSLGTNQNTLQDPQVTVQNFLNQVSFCQSRTCGCPSTTDKTGFRDICSGNGQCQLEFGQDVLSDVPCTTDAECQALDAKSVCKSDQGPDGLKACTCRPGIPSCWFCACEAGYEGSACEDPGINNICPQSWNDRLQTLQPCGGANQGTCNPVTRKCDCVDGWSGTDCAKRVCATVGGEVCSGHGFCNSAQECICTGGFSGPACNCSVSGTTGKLVCRKPDGSNAVDPGSVSGLQQDVNHSQTTMIIVVAVCGACLAVIVGVTVYFVYFKRYKKAALNIKLAKLQDKYGA